jgi:hypothetical protein
MNKNVTKLDIFLSCLLGAALGLLFAYGLLGGF